MSEFGGLIRDARERLGLSPHRVGELIGRASGTVKAWERGRTIPNDPFVVTSLAAVLAIDERALFRAAGLTPPDAPPVTTIEQQLASIAPAAPISRTAAPEPATVLTDEVSEVEANPEPEPAEGGSALEVVTDVLQKGKAVLVEAGAPVLAGLRRSREEQRPRPAAIPPPTAPVPTGSYMDDPDERWSYRLRTVWTAAGLGALGVLLLWAGSRALDALGDTWNALLAGL
jgi:transcriptional regulator with XRE-family HTH domain